MKNKFVTPTSGFHFDSIRADEAGTLPGLFRLRVERSPDAVAYRQYDAGQEIWKDYSWAQMADHVIRWRTVLGRENLATGDRVAILLRNSVEWVGFEQAALVLGLVVVPLYTSDTIDSITYILADSGARVLFEQNPQGWWPHAEQRARLPELERVLCLEGVAPDDDSGPLFRCVKHWPREPVAPMVDKRQDPDALATLVYTSGTTGHPKGVMLSHYNILWNADTILRGIPAYREDLFLSFLPLSHAFERTVGYCLPMMAGSTVAYSRSVAELAEDLLNQRPTVLVSVPRIYERVYAKIQEQLDDKGVLAHWLFNQAVRLGWRRFEAAQGRASRPGPIQRVLWSVLEHLVAGKILSRLGGRLRIAVSGGAPLSEPIARFFIGLGLPISQGYGLTEAAPVVSGNLLEANIPASVGVPFEDVEIRLGAHDELLLRSPGVMMGYWGLPEATRKAVDADKWLHTGDVAEIRDGHLYIRGRLKEILVMSTGEKAAPADLELAITLDPLFNQAMVIGEGKPFLGVLLVLNRKAWNQFATRLGLQPSAPAALSSEVARQALLERIGRLLHDFPHHAQVHSAWLTLDSWSIKNGLITPTMKLKRSVMEDRFAAEISDLYTGHEVR